jgi:hypothetical protein
MSTIFISHSSTNRALVGEVFAELLDALGYQVWLDTKSIRLSEKWKPLLAKGLEAADWFLVVVSREASESEWVKHETAWAIENLSSRVIPIVIDDSEPSAVDARLCDYQYYSYVKEPARTIAALTRLLVDAKYGGYDRDLSGNWISAVQPVYYASRGWHVQTVKIISMADGYRVQTQPGKDKLQWRLDAKLIGNAFFAGPWRSTRAGSRSQGYMTLQVSRNGSYMCGHDYAMVFEESKAHFGVLLLARSSDTLEEAWRAMRAARRELLPLTEVHDFANDDEASATE